MGKSPRQAAKDATSEIGFAVIATTSAVILVFLPVAMVSGVIGRYFFEFGLTVVFSMAVSLLISFTLVPMMASKMLRLREKKSKTIIGRFFKLFNNKFDILASKYLEVNGAYTTVSNSSASIKIELVDKLQRKDNSRDFAKKLSGDLQNIPGAQVSVAAASMAGGGRTSKDATTKQVSAEAQEQIEGIQKVSQFSEELNVVVKKLNSAIDQFKVN